MRSGGLVVPTGRCVAELGAFAVATGLVGRLVTVALVAGDPSRSRIGVLLAAVGLRMQAGLGDVCLLGSLFVRHCASLSRFPIVLLHRYPRSRPAKRALAGQPQSGSGGPNSWNIRVNWPSPLAAAGSSDSGADTKSAFAC